MTGVTFPAAMSSLMAIRSLWSGPARKVTSFWLTNRDIVSTSAGRETRPISHRLPGPPAANFDQDVVVRGTGFATSSTYTTSGEP